MIAIWWTGVIVTLVVFVPLAVYLLHTTFRAARSIQIYAREALTAAAGVAGNTRHIPALDATLSTAGQMLGTAVEVDKKLGTIANVLAQRAGS
jgi:hypothetical protein